MLKKLLIAVGIIIVIPLFTALMLDNEYEVERSITIERPVKSVFSYIKYLRNQNEYSTWTKLDPKTKHTYTGTDGTVGFISAWSSEHPDVGVGEQEIKAIKPNDRIDFELRFIEPFQATEPAYMTTTKVSKGETKVTWGFKGKIDYPMNLMFLFVDFEQQIGNDLQQGLNNLKEILESKNSQVKFL